MRFNKFKLIYKMGGVKIIYKSIKNIKNKVQL